MENKNNDEIVIDLGRILLAFWHRIWIILLAAVVAGAAAFCVARFVMTPQYQAAVTMYVNNSAGTGNETSITSSDLTASKSLVDTYAIILKSHTTLDAVLEITALQYSYEELSNMISAAAVNSTEVFRITVTGENPAKAMLIANTIADVAMNTIPDVVAGSSVRIVDYAGLPTSPSGPNVTKYTAIGVILGIFLSCAAIVVAVMLDNQIHEEAYLIQTYDIPVLACIPDLLSEKTRSSYEYYGGK